MTRRVSSGAAIGVGLAGVALLAVIWFIRGPHGPRDFPRRSLERGGGDVAFVDEASCRQCHDAQAAAWAGSHHDRAMQVAGPGTVLGDFNDAVFDHRGDTTRFSTSNGRFVVTATGSSGTAGEYEVLYTFGVEPLQQYLVRLPGGRLQALTVAWDTERGRWFSLYPDEDVAPGSPLHWTGRLNRWNDRCAECHSTDLHVAYDAGTDSYRTTWAAMNVGCQACHGPGEAHVEWAGGSRSGGTGLVADLRRNGAWLDTCGACHSRRSRVSGEDAHGRSFHDDFELALLREDLYHPDGQIKEEVYETGSFMQSLMYRRGVGCGDCHDAHSARLVANGNALCTRCHQPRPPSRFATLRPREYDSAAHHRHDAGSPGAACVSCHMPGRTYMVVDKRRDHSLRIPRPDLSVKLGTPNACTGCHTDRSDQWAARIVRGWWGAPGPGRHYGEVLARGRAREPGAEAGLARLATDTSQPAIVRATALDLLGRVGGPPALITASVARSDSSPLVRLAAVKVFERVPADSALPVLAEALNDAAGAVRMTAARLLAPYRGRLGEPETRQALDRELSLFQAAQQAQADQPEANHNLGNLHVALGQLDSAEWFYARSVHLDTMFLPPQLNLATLYNQRGQNAEAERVLRRAVGMAPEVGELHFSLGLLLGEEGRMPEAAQHLSMAAERLPQQPRVHYNLGLVLQQAGQVKEAEGALLRAQRLAPGDPTFVNGLAFYYRQTGRRDQAVRYGRMLLDLLPDDPRVRDLVDELERGRTGKREKNRPRPTQ